MDWNLQDNQVTVQPLHDVTATGPVQQATPPVAPPPVAHTPLPPVPGAPTHPTSTPIQEPTKVRMPEVVQEAKPKTEAVDSEKALDSTADEVLAKVFERVYHVLTKVDKEEFETLLGEDVHGAGVRYFLLSRVPHFDKLVEEEIAKFKEESSK